MEDRIEKLVEKMTLEEKVSMCSGSGLWLSTPVERLSIPPFKMSDGPNGVRGDARGGITSACFPSGIALASTWDKDLIYSVGEALGEEARLKDAQVLLGPTVNLHRHPLGGRNFESFSEDPFLTGTVGVAYIKGVQSKGVATAVKHFVCNDSEFERHTISADLDERTLREVYLLPFEMAVRDAGTWSIMSSYNKINGIWASESDGLLNGILKQEWGFDGYVVSDWNGHNNTIECANGGLDLEMPGPAKTFGAHLQDAVNKGDVPVSIIDDKCRRLLRTLVLTGRLDRQEMTPLAEKSGASPATCQLIRQTAAQGMVLLKNQGVLPIDIDKGEIKKIAVIGPNAAVARIQGGGSAGVNSPHAVSPLQGIREACGNQVKVLYAEGCTNHKRVPLLDTKMLTPSQGGEGQGFEVRYYNNLDFSGAPVETRIVRRSEFFWFGRFSDLVDPQCFSARMEASLTPSQTCRWQISLASAGLSRLWIDDELFINNWEDQEPGDIYFSKGSTEVIREVALEAGRDYRLRLDYSTAHSGFVAGLRVGMMPLSETDPVAEAVSLAVESDLVILCAGLNSEWDTEGYDRPDMSLPGDQVRLIRSVAQANENTVVVLNNGSAVAMHEWIMDVRAVLEAWYPGQEAGHALADILLGKVNPSGRLTQTFPLRIEDAPAMCRPPHSYPGVKGSVIYEEALLVGYRYYDYHDLMPLFPFGHGLSYTEFDYNDLSLDKSLYAIGDDVHIRFTVANKGDRAGAEVVQLYVGAMELQEGEPVQTLKGFSKLFLMPGECKTVEMSIGFRDLAFWNVQTKNWEQAPGEYALRIGASSRDLRLAAVCRFVTA